MHMTIEWSANSTGPIADVPYSNGTVCGYYLNATSEAPILFSVCILGSDCHNNTIGEALSTRLIPLTDFDTKDPSYGNGSVRFENIQYPLPDALILSAPNGLGVHQNKVPIVYECVLS